MNRLTLTDCSFSWDRQRRPLFEDVSFDMEAGTWTLLGGLSGSGKSTLALLCAGLIAPTAGKISFGGRTAPSRRTIQFLFQDPFAAIDPLMTVGQWFLHVVKPDRGSARKTSQSLGAGEASPNLASILDLLRLEPEILNARPLELSGGECQRVNLAAALSASPQILILDEPFTMVDDEARTLMLDLLKGETSKAGAALLLIHHGELQGATPIDQVLELSGGRVVKFPRRSGIL